MPSVRIVGLGRAGRSFQRALTAAGWHVDGVGRETDLQRAAVDVDLVLICTPDDAVATVAASITEVSQHRLYRRELATALVTVLEREEPTLRRLACAALGGLHATQVRQALMPLLSDPDVGVRESARAALGQLSTRLVRHQ